MTDDPAPNHSPAERATTRRGATLAVAVGLAVVVAAVGLAARPGLHLPNYAGANPHAARDLALLITTILLGVVMMWIGRHVTVGYQRLTYLLVGLVLVVVPLLVVNISGLIDSARRAQPTRSPTPTPTAAVSGAASSEPQAHRGNGTIPKLSVGDGWAIISLILTVAAVLLLGWLAYRVLRGRDGRQVGAVGLPQRATDRDDVLRRATSALDLGADPRGRVIAAYEAMESALAHRTAARTAPQAPLEWLAGLADVQAAAMRPARELTTIFERARFSSAPVSEADAARARQLLEQLRATLSARAGTPAGEDES